MMRNGHNDEWMLGGQWAFWVACGIAFLLIAILVVALLGVMVRDQVSPSTTPQRERSEAIELLERRFAAGELDEDEFRRRRVMLLDRRG